MTKKKKKRKNIRPCLDSDICAPGCRIGDDGISHKMLMGVTKSVSKPLCILMNRSFEEGIFSDIWKIANVISIFKKGDKSQPI